MSHDTADRVLVLGAGPVGLGAALELARCGVRSVLIEKHDSTSWHPKTRNFNTRTMEIARAWGPAVYQRLRAIDTPPGWKSPIRFLRSAVGEQFGLIESKGFEGPGPEVSPAWPVMSSQELIEAILLDGVRASGLVDVRFATEATRLLSGGRADEREDADGAVPAGRGHVALDLLDGEGERGGRLGRVGAGMHVAMVAPCGNLGRGPGVHTSTVPLRRPL